MFRKYVDTAPLVGFAFFVTFGLLALVNHFAGWPGSFASATVLAAIISLVVGVAAIVRGRAPSS